MSTLVRSNIQISASDVSNALFAELQQGLISKRDSIQAQAHAIYEEARKLSAEYILTEQNVLSFENSYVLNQVCALYNLCNDDKLHWELRYNNNIFFNDPGGNYLTINGFTENSKLDYVLKPAVFYVYFYTKKYETEEEVCKFSIAGLEISTQQHSSYGEEFLTAGETVTFKNFSSEIYSLHKKITELRIQINDVNKLINGQIDPKTGLTLRDFIGATLATQAIAQIPELSQAFNIELLCSNINQKLLGGLN